MPFASAFYYYDDIAFFFLEFWNVVFFEILLFITKFARHFRKSVVRFYYFAVVVQQKADAAIFVQCVQDAACKLFISKI